MATPEEQVLYDLPTGGLDEAALVKMLADPQQRWYARALLAAMAVKGMVAATFDESLHPRGRDGKFIKKFGYVRWLDGLGKWRRGLVMDIETNGDVKVKHIASNTGETSEIVWPSSSAKKELYSVPAPKAKLSLPDPAVAQDVHGWEKVGGQGGSNPGGLYKSVLGFGDTVKPGDKVYIKHGKSENHVATEVLANRLYELAGVNVADTYAGEDSITLGSKLVHAEHEKVDLKAKMSDHEALALVQRDFVVDAWLANWDVAGLGLENIQLVDGVPYRIDAGGALTYRAQGAPKGSMFGSKVGELETMRDKGMNAQAAAVFGGVDDNDLKDGAQRIAAIDPEMVLGLVENAELDAGLGETLVARRTYILEKLGVDDPFIVPEDPEEPQEEPEEPFDFLKFLSGEEKYEPVAPNELEWGFVETASPVMMAPSPGEKSYLLWKKEGAAVADLYEIETADFYNIIGTNIRTGEGLNIPSSDFTTSPVFYALVVDNRVDPQTNAILQQFIDYANLKIEWDASNVKKLPVFKSDEELGIIDALDKKKAVSDLNVSSVLDPSVVIEYDGIYNVFLYTTNGINLTDDESAAVWSEYTAKWVIGQDLDTLTTTAGEFLLWVDSTHPELTAQAQKELISYIDDANLGRGTSTSVSSEIDPNVPLTWDEMHAAWVEATKVLDEEFVVAYVWQSLSDKLNSVGANNMLATGDFLNWVSEKHSQLYFVVETYLAGKSKDSFADLPDTTPSESHGAVDPLMELLGETMELIDSPGIEHSPLPDSSGVKEVNGDLNVGPEISLGALSGVARKEMAESLVGKVLLMRGSDLKYSTDEDDGSEYLKYTFGSNSPPGYGLGYVESSLLTDDGSGVLKIRMSNGQSRNMSFNTWDTSKGVSVRVVHNVEANDFKTAAKPTFKDDGTVTYAGSVIGTWHKFDPYEGGSYSYADPYGGSYSYPYTVKLDAEHTIFGIPMALKTSQKGSLKDHITYSLIPKSPPTKSKKTGAVSVAKVVEAVEMKPGGTYASGEEAQLGDWVASTKGGAGFVGKVVGWPHQEAHPGLVFAVSVDGVQKAVKIKTTKKVPKPSQTEPLMDGSVDVVLEYSGPNAYYNIKLGDGNHPKVGQLVEAGAPGKPKTTGIITNISVKQGWVYIQTADGKSVSKTFAVTKVLEQPNLMWEIPTPALVSVLLDKKKKTSVKVKGISYPGLEGALLKQEPEVKGEWLAGHPKRKLTKDGYAPTLGMTVRNKDGDTLVITKISDEWQSNPNAIKVWNIDEQKMASTSTTLVEVDHAAATTALGGTPLQLTNSVSLLGAVNAGSPLPDGTKIYRYAVLATWYSNGKTRTAQQWHYIAIQPDNTIIRYYSNYGNSAEQTYSGDTALTNLFKGQEPAGFEQVALIDSSATQQLAIQPYSVSWMTGNKQEIVQSNAYFLNPEEAPAPVDKEVTKPAAVPKPAPVATPADSDPVFQKLLADEKELEKSLKESPAGESDYGYDDVEQEAPTEKAPDPVTIAESSLTALIPPPTPPSAIKQKKILDPAVPEVTKKTYAFDEKHPVMSGPKSRSVAEGAKEMLAKKDSKESGSGITYATGDTDLIDDMAIRYNVEKDANGNEHLVARFRLREEPSEELVAQLVTPGESVVDLGDWKVKGMVFAKNLKDGDMISVYLSGTTKMLKPESAANNRNPVAPNVRVVGTPTLIAKAPVKEDGSVGKDLYRIKVLTDKGITGEVDMEHREEGNIPTFEYDPTAIKKVSGKQLKITNTATQAGWVKTGTMMIKGGSGTNFTDDTGKANFGHQEMSSMTTGGSGGHHFQRVMPDGSIITFNGVHSSESGTGFKSPRKANIAGEIKIKVPIKDGQPDESVVAAVSAAMQAVGVPVEKQKPPTDEQLYTFALSKLVSNYLPTYTYRSMAVTSPDDPRVQQTLDHMSTELQTHLGRNVMLEDVRIHTHTNGRMQVVFSPEVAKAIGKRQGNHHFHHGGASGRVVSLFGGPINGLLATDERWSAGVMYSGQSSHTDMTYGSGDRVYTRASTSVSWPSGNVIINPLMQASSLEVYTKNSSDSFGDRGTINHFLTKGGHIEYMQKRGYTPEQITFYIVKSESERESAISQLKAMGVTHVGKRPIEEIIVTSSQAQKTANFEDIGIEYFADDIPITQLAPAVV